MKSKSVAVVCTLVSSTWLFLVFFIIIYLKWCQRRLIFVIFLGRLRGEHDKTTLTNYKQWKWHTHALNFCIIIEISFCKIFIFYMLSFTFVSVHGLFYFIIVLLFYFNDEFHSETLYIVWHHTLIGGVTKGRHILNEWFLFLFCLGRNV